MSEFRFAGPLLRHLRLEKNWSQETLCAGICAVSYLSKIEQGKVDANPALLADLFQRLGKTWQTDPTALETERQICRKLYEAVFTCDFESFDRNAAVLKCDRELPLGPYYLDFLILRNYRRGKPEIAPELEKLLEGRQGCLAALTREDPELAYRRYPCALTSHCVGVKAYQEGNYTLSLEYLQRSYDLASGDGCIRVMMLCQVYMANCYSDLQNCREMERHSKIAERIARCLGDHEMIQMLRYNMASTQMECGKFEESYQYFHALEEPSILELHKLAICCEKLGKPEEAQAALHAADEKDIECHPVERKMCDVVRYRLEHSDYLTDERYGALLLDVFRTLRQKMPKGFARFHLPWVREWLTANRKYREAYELMLDFT